MFSLHVLYTVVFRNSLKIVTLSETSAHIECPIICSLATQTCQNEIQTHGMEADCPGVKASANSQR